ncbi:MAG TPA: HAMP domain-containing sensor histidine kinase [Kiritimatiellia bacterium]|nr:HAMP domain-containing sensor histidine kinase [Kiritimatiellia bacterium]HRU70746.1 HAMP domain-containing sensor histidine kinase [Kiritimatiellia bacterium]
MTVPRAQPSTPRHGIWRLEIILLLALLTTALGAGGVLHFLKWQHDRQAHLAATETVLREGEALLDTLNGVSMASTTNLTPARWRQFSAMVDSAFSVRKDVQSISVSRDGETLFHRQAGGLHDAPSPPQPPGMTPADTSAGESETEMSQGSLEIGGVRQPVFVITRTHRLPDGSQVTTEATFKREAVGAEEQTARALVSSLFTFSVGVLILSFAICAGVLLVAVARDRRREARARQEEHLAFSGVLANGILHDFRNPMSAVRLDAQMLGKELAREEGFRPERVRDLAGRIARTMARMDKIFQEFLFLARPADERPEPVDLDQVVRECTDTLAPRAEQAGVTLRARPHDPLPPAAAYPFALRRALLNIIVNAIQFAPRGSEVTVVLGRHETFLAIEVLDRGPGIPAAQRQTVFDMFVTGRPEGTGLGLFLARTAVRRCGGDIEALARDGGGARLRITLPAAPQPPS